MGYHADLYCFTVTSSAPGISKEYLVKEKERRLRYEWSRKVLAQCVSPDPHHRRKEALAKRSTGGQHQLGSNYN